MARPDRQRGGATVLLLAMGLVFVVFGTFGAAIVAAGMASQRAAVAADLGALAGAARALDGDTAACASALLDLAGRNDGRLVGCHLDGLDVLVTVEVAFSAATTRPDPGGCGERPCRPGAGLTLAVASPLTAGACGAGRVRRRARAAQGACGAGRVRRRARAAQGASDGRRVQRRAACGVPGWPRRGDQAQIRAGAWSKDLGVWGVWWALWS